MGQVVDIKTVRREPHVSGEAKCLACLYVWIAVIPTGTIWLECPGCSLLRGRFMYPTVDHNRLHLTCRCGNDLFFITKDFCYCPNCGDEKTDF